MATNSLTVEAILDRAQSERGFTRKELHTSYFQDYVPFCKAAERLDMSLPDFCNYASPKREYDGLPNDAIAEMFAHSNLVVNQSMRRKTATMSELADEGPTETLMWSLLDRDYDAASGMYDLEKTLKFADVGATEGELPERSSLRPRATRELYERNKFRPPIMLSQITSSMQTIDADAINLPEYTQAAEDERSKTLTEFENIPLTSITISERSVRLKRIGAGVRVSRQFELNNIRMTAIRTWIRRQGMRDEIRMIHEGVNTLIAAAVAAGGPVESIGTTPSFQQILGVYTGFGTSSGYAVDLLITSTTNAETFLAANTAVSQNGYVLRDLPDRAQVSGGILPRINYVNANVMEVNLIGFDNVQTAGGDDPGVDVGINLPTNQMLAVDSRFALIFLRRTRGIVTAEQYFPRSESRERYMTQYFGWGEQDRDAVRRNAFA